MSESNGVIGQPAAPLTNPYPGPRPFEIDEEPIFFGRTRETAYVRSLVLGHSVVLLYAESGAGKTSLLKAGVIPALRGKEVTVFPVARIRPSSPGIPVDSSAKNVFVASIAANWALEQGRNLSGIESLSDLIKLMVHAHEASPDEPHVFIVDQFEELFTQYLEYWHQRDDFFAEVQGALDADPDLRVLLAMREDYLAQTDPHVAALASRLQYRCRLERLRREAALAAIVEPLRRTNRSFTSGAAEYLAEQLLQIRLERQGGLVEVTGQFVEPVQLQIVCSSLWQRLEMMREPISKIDVDLVRRLAQVDRALARFYGDVVRRAAVKTGTSEFELRRWCEASLITLGGTRALVYRGADETEGMPNEVIELLESEHLIRAEERAGARWYELSHDKFVGAIQSGNRRAFEEHAGVATEITEKADAWARRIDEVIEALRTGDEESRRAAIDELLPAITTDVSLSVSAGVPFARERLVALDSVLSDATRDPDLDPETRRSADSFRLILAERGAQGEATFRNAYTAAIRWSRIDPGLLAAGVAVLAGLLAGSMLGITLISERVLARWSVPHLAGSPWWVIGAIVTLWIGIYGWETAENFPLDRWRRSLHQFRHTITAPFAPLRDWISWYELISIWPLSLLIPWSAAAATATIAFRLWEWPFSLVFWLVLSVGTLFLGAVYVETEI